MLRMLRLLLSLSWLAIAAAQAVLTCTTDQVVLSGTYDLQEINLACTDGTKLFTIDSNANVTLNFPQKTQLNNVRFTVSEGGSLNFIGNAATFSGANVQDNGGVINNSGTVVFDNDVTFENNTAANGGAIFNDAAGSITFSKAVTFTSNTAATGGFGGALYVTGGAVVFSDAVTFDTTTTDSIYITAGTDGSVQFPSLATTLIAPTDTGANNCNTGASTTDCGTLVSQVTYPTPGLSDQPTSAPTVADTTAAPTDVIPATDTPTEAPTEVSTTSAPTVAFTIGGAGTVPPTSTPVTARDLTLTFQITGASTSTFTDAVQLNLRTGIAALTNVPQDNVQILSDTDVPCSNPPGACRRLDAVPVLEVTAGVQASATATADITASNLSAITGMNIGDITVVEVPITGGDSGFPTWAIVLITLGGAAILIGSAFFIHKRKTRENKFATPLPQHHTTLVHQSMKSSSPTVTESFHNAPPPVPPRVIAPVFSVPAAPSSDGNMYFSIQDLDTSGNVTKYCLHLNGGSAPATWDIALKSLRENNELADLLTKTLAKTKHEAFFFELIPVRAETTHQTPFEFIVKDAPELARPTPDPTQFNAYIGAGSGTSEVKSFYNLGRDAMLVSPCCATERRCYGHLAAFVRYAPREQIRLLWRVVGKSIEHRLQSNPRSVWVSTSGMGVPWLHFRICDLAKYYTHRPYWSDRTSFVGNVSVV